MKNVIRAHMRSLLLLSALLGGMTTAMSGVAQPNVDITLVDNGNNELEVRLRPDGDFSDFFSSIVFTIRWDATSPANLGNVSQVMPEAAYIPVAKSGDDTTANGYRYQVFAGFGTVPLNTLGASWSANQEVTLMTIPVVNGSSMFEIVNDSWTGDVQNNGDYYISLNGLDVTGVIYSIPTGILMGDPLLGSFDVRPNPTDGRTDLFLTVPKMQDILLEMTDATGRMVWKEARTDLVGDLHRSIDLSRSAPGMYTLRVITPERTLVRRIVRR
ncbi:MAG: T9SS type A sorting domain-containing protein [Flavobacteriales bacterium]|nr:T9SS type A sorting domain-containing protein [Flavobacteriales bacterium]MCB9193591.1 T9SS type A sorting domain-containing protein [Flavobacteriales bacterium]